MESIFEDMHSQRLDALVGYAAATMGAMRAGVHAIGAAYAEVAEIKPRHSVKSFVRFLSNKGLDVAKLRPAWSAFVLGARPEVLLALDWTEFDDDDHATLCMHVVTNHGRATPLFWKTVKKSELRGKRTDLELALVNAAQEAIPVDVRVTLLADRGSGSQVLYEQLDMLGWNYVIRFRGAILVEHEGVSKPAKDWLSPSGRATRLTGARVTKARTEVGAVIAVRAKAMKEAWFLATNLTERAAAEVVKLYARRFTIEDTFRDEKDLRFGMGLRATHIRNADRRDRLLLAIAHAFLTLIGAASERSGMDAWLKVNT
ncbi:MAG: IS4 family transposase [Labilithrix sp.]|nr:IS4 family transposase [Labilithrix sp.]